MPKYVRVWKNFIKQKLKTFENEKEKKVSFYFIIIIIFVLFMLKLFLSFSLVHMCLVDIFSLQSVKPVAKYMKMYLLFVQAFFLFKSDILPSPLTLPDPTSKRRNKTSYNMFLVNTKVSHVTNQENPE